MTRFLNSLDVSTQAQTDAQGKLIGTFTTMPAASALNVGCTVKYIGSEAGYTTGAFYTCEQSGTSYAWVMEENVASDLTDEAKEEVRPKAGTGISIGSDGVTVNHSNSITARTSYLGSTTTVPRIQYDAQGHITAATTSTIYPPTTAGTAYQYWSSDGSGAGTWRTPATSATSGSSVLISSDAVYTELQDLQSQIDSIEGQVEAVDSFNVQVVSSLPSTGVEKTIYFVPADTTGTNNVRDEYMWINSAWEKIGSSEFDLDITQNTSGITINNTSLQTATASRPGIMTASQVSALETATSNISTIQNSITTINQSITNLEETVENIESSGSGVSVAAGTGISVSQSGTTYTVGHSNSTTAHTTYVGSTTTVPRIQCDAQGHITAITTAAIYPPTTAGTANQYWRSDGSGTGAWTTPATSATSGSSTLISSGAVYTALQDKADADTEVTGGSFSSTTGTLTLNKSSGNISITGLPTSSGTVSETTVSAGTGISVTASGSNYTVGHSNSTTAHTSYVGDATAIPRIQCDAQGHITSLGTVLVYPPTTAGTANQYWRSDGSGTGQWTTPATSPTSGSSTLISSGAVYTALQDKADADDVITGGTFSNGTLTLTRSSGNITVTGMQASVTGGASTITTSNLTVERALISNASGKVAVSDVTSTELGYLDGATGNIQGQIDALTETVSDLEGNLSGATYITSGFSSYSGRPAIGYYISSLGISGIAFGVISSRGIISDFVTGSTPTESSNFRCMFVF